MSSSGDHAAEYASGSDRSSGAPSRSSRVLLAMAATAVAFAAADTYVVVLALPDMMVSAGISIDQLQKAAPIISGFLLGYVAMLPLIGRIADLRGRVPVLAMSLVVFAIGSFLTALAYDMPSMVTGRFLQGVGGGGLVPATLALVADLYPVHRRAVPLGVVSAVQELGSVMGPLLGALVLAVADWRAIFALNLAVGLLLAAAVRLVASEELAGVPRRRISRPDLLGVLLLVTALACCTVTMTQPAALKRDLIWGELFVPLAAGHLWSTPIGVITLAMVLLFLIRCWCAARPLVDLRGWSRAMWEADLLGALLLGLSLSGVILAFATADPAIQLFSDQGLWYLLGSAIAAILFAIHLRRANAPLIPTGALRRRAAWGSLLVSFFVGWALIAALIDIPLMARTTVYTDSQLMAALVLVKFLVALPVGAVIGGLLTKRWPAGVVTGVGMLCSAVAFFAMTQWGMTSLEQWHSTLTLILGGFGFGLALAPVNAAVLASTRHEVHGLASALVVVARMVGMLVGISALTALGLRMYFQETAKIPPVTEVCGGSSRCAAFTDLVQEAALVQEHAVFFGAGVACLIAALSALVLFRGADTRGVDTREAIGGLG